MNKRSCWIFVFLVFLCPLTLGMGSSPSLSDPITVVSTTIRDGEVLRKNKPFVIMFSAPMVSENSLNKPVPKNERPFHLSPEVKGQGIWLTQTSYSFSAEKGYPRGKTYHVILNNNLRSLDGKKVQYTYSFRTEPVFVQNIYVDKLDKTQLPVQIYFSKPVSSKALQDHLSVTDTKTGETLDIKVINKPKDQTFQNFLVRIDKYRSNISLRMRVDLDNDSQPLGLSSEYLAELKMPNPEQQGEQGLSTNVSIISEKNQPSLQKIKYGYSNEEYETGDISVAFSLQEQIDEKDSSNYISIVPNLPFSLANGGRSVRVYGNLEPQSNVTLTLKKGLADSKGRILQDTLSYTVTIPDRRSNIFFADQGNYLTPAYGSNVNVMLTNIDKVSVSLTRLFENNSAFLSLTESEEKYGKQIAYKEVELSNSLNQVVERSVNIEDLAGKNRGIFILSLEGYAWKINDNYRNLEWQTSSKKIVVLSDIGITSRVFPSGLSVFVTNLSTGKPLAGGQVKVYTSSNQILGEGLTDESGKFFITQKEAWDKNFDPKSVTVSTNNDFSFLPLNYSTQISLNDAGEKDYLDNGFEAFLYSSRGVFRPGETVQIKSFVRNAQQKPPSVSFPVMFIVKSSRGSEVARGSNLLSREGGADFSFSLPRTASTGSYEVLLQIPGQKDKTLGRMDISIEDFVPPRLEVSISPEKLFLTPEEKQRVTLSARYLFGTPGESLNYELGYKVTSQNFSPKQWEGYFFGDAEKNFKAQSNIKYIKGVLGKNGTAIVDFPVLSEWQPPAALKVTLLGSIQEDSGRWVTGTESFTYYPSPYFIGLKTEGKVNAGEPVNIKFVAVKPDGSKASPGNVMAELLRVDRNWHMVYKDGRYSYTWDEKITTINKQSVSVKNGEATFTINPKSSGRYIIRCSASASNVVGSLYFYAKNNGEVSDEGSGRMDNVELSLDKPEYTNGETAQLSIKSPFSGTLILGIERRKQIETKVINLTSPAMSLPIQVDDRLFPNATVTAWVIRGVTAKDKEWYSHRAYGAIPLKLSKAPYTLKVEVEHPSQAMPGKPISIPFTVTDSNGSPVTGEFSVALVDEGILSLTAFKTPSPLSFFMAQRRAVGISYDGFDRLLRPGKKYKPLLKAGGDDTDSYFGSLSPQNVFLAEVIPTIKTDVQGKATATFSIPEYSGKGRLMVVGASGASFASSSSQIIFSRDLVVEVSAPRAVAPGDTFDISIASFLSNPEMINKATVTLNASGPILLDTKETSFTISSAKEQHIVTATAISQEGIASMDAVITVPERPEQSFRKHVEFVVRSPYPATSSTSSAIIKAGKKVTITPEGEWILGSSRSIIGVDRSPAISILPALDFLRSYPYGCLEQVTSRALSYLTLNTIQEAMLDSTEKEARQKNNNLALEEAIKTLETMQSASGGFSMWAGNYSVDMWKSVNASLFLVESKSQVHIPARMFSSAMDFLRFTLAAPVEIFGSEEVAYSTKAFAAFVLARNGDVPHGWIQSLVEHEKKMFVSGRIFLAGAKSLAMGNSDPLKSMNILKGSVPATLFSNKTMESDMRNIALRLYMWSIVEPNNSETMRLAAQLAKLLQSNTFFTTQDAGMASLAFGTYIQKAGLSKDSVKKVNVVSGNDHFKAQSLPENFLRKEEGFDSTGKAFSADISVSEGSGQIYATYVVRGVPKDAPKPAMNGINVQRDWLDSSGNPLMKNDQGMYSLKQGELVTVALTVSVDSPVSDIVVLDLLPGGMEIENPRLKTSSSSEDLNSTNDSSVNIDFRDDRLALFLGELRRSFVYKYTTRVVTPGVYSVPQIGAEAMYNPQINFIGLPSKVTISR